MSYNPEIYHRRSIRLRGYDYTQSGAYFITIVAKDRECLFGDVLDGEIVLNENGRIVAEEWTRASAVRSRVALDMYVVMPNHAHGIIVINDPNDVGATRRVAPTGAVPGSIGAIIGQFKSIVTKRINAVRGMPGATVWQRNYYEHVIRNERELDVVRQYIVNNPAQWALDLENPSESAQRIAVQQNTIVGATRRGAPTRLRRRVQP